MARRRVRSGDWRRRLKLRAVRPRSRAPGDPALFLPPTRLPGTGPGPSRSGAPPVPSLRLAPGHSAHTRTLEPWPRGFTCRACRPSSRTPRPETPAPRHLRRRTFARGRPPPVWASTSQDQKPVPPRSAREDQQLGADSRPDERERRAERLDLVRPEGRGWAERPGLPVLLP